jgi:iron complex outermembrane recepter protein
LNAGEEPYGDGGNGTVRLALRGHATLVLVNGRRFPNSGEGADASVDLNTLPISFVDRVEVLASGASAIYGSDAVGGVVNIVTRRDMAGFTVAGSQTLSRHGDGPVTTGQAAAGFDLFGGTWILGVDHVKQEAVTLDRRDYSAVPLGIVDGNGTLAPFRNLGMPQGEFAVPEGNTLGLAPGMYTRVEGATGRSAADYRPIDPAADYFNVAPYHYLQTPNERSALWLIGSYPLGGGVNLFVEGLVHHRESAHGQAPDNYFGGSVPELPDGSLGIPANNFYNPFGVDLVGSGPELVSRRMVELGNRRRTEEVDLWRALVGLEGRIADWWWTFSVADAESDAVTVQTGVFSRMRLIPAIGPSGPDESGRIVCGPPDSATGVVAAANIIPGCVPVDLFGGPGSITPDQLQYLYPGPARNAGTNEQQTAELVLRGPWGQLSGQDLHWVLGLEYLREAGSSVPSPWQIEEHGITALRAADSEARELFAEVRVPLLEDRRWAREMDVNLGLRWSDYSSFDNHLSWQVGMHWQPVKEWTLRANYADVFQAPDLWALHDPGITEQYFALDPCGNDPTETQRAHCEAHGVPSGAYVQGTEAFVVRAGGNQKLEPETGLSLGAGVQYTPQWMEDVSISIDFFHLEITNLIRRFFVEQVLSECAEHGLSQACDDIERFPDGRIKRVSTFNENLGGLYETRGIDFAIDWAASTALGDVDVRLLATYLERWDEQPFLEGTVYEYAGTFAAGAMPHWRGLGSVEWHSGSWLASYSAEYIGSFTQEVHSIGDYFELGPFGDRFSEPFEPYTRRVESVLYHDLEGRYEFRNGITVRAAITNVTDEDPPFVNLASIPNTDAGTYRLLGRSYFLELRYQFE